MVMERFGFEREMSLEAVQERLKEHEETIRRRILREMKIMEGAENMRRATSDKKSLAHVRTIVNEVNSTLHNLNQELNDVRTYLLMTNDDCSGDVGSTTTRQRPGIHFNHYTTPHHTAAHLSHTCSQTHRQWFDGSQNNLKFKTV